MGIGHMSRMCVCVCVWLYKAWGAGVAQASGKFGGQGNQLQAILGLTDHQASISLSVDSLHALQQPGVR